MNFSVSWSQILWSHKMGFGVDKTKIAPQLGWDNMNVFPLTGLTNPKPARAKYKRSCNCLQKYSFVIFFPLYTLGRSATMKIKWWLRPHPTNRQQLTTIKKLTMSFHHVLIPDIDLKLQSMVTHSCPYIPWSLRTIIVQCTWISPDNLRNRGCWAWIYMEKCHPLISQRVNKYLYIYIYTHSTLGSLQALFCAHKHHSISWLSRHELFCVESDWH